MADWAVSPTADTDWHFELDDFVRRLTERWPDAVTEPGRSSNSAVEFTVSFGDDPVDGYLASGGQAVWIEGDVGPAAGIAAWVREQVPEEQELSLYDQAYEAVVPLRGEMTADEIAAAAVS